MKKNIILFMISLLEIYLILSFFVPPLKVGLIASPSEYFLANITERWVFKFIISLILSFIVIIINKKLINTKKRENIMKIILMIILIITIIIIINDCSKAMWF